MDSEVVVDEIVPSKVESVTLRHPHSGKTVVVEDSSTELISLMGKGFEQVREKNNGR